MNVIVVGLGIQGNKRRRIAGEECVATVDPVNSAADYGRIEDVPPETYDAALVCTPDAAKIPVLTYLLESGKHVLVEKPLVAAGDEELLALAQLAQRRGLACYTAYNHRFEPNLARLKEVIDAGTIGNVLVARFFYGNGTAADVRKSPWRDRGMGVVPDLASHLLDLVDFLIGRPETPFSAWSAAALENRACDHAVIGSAGRPVIEMETTLLSWRNSFYAELLGDRGSAHVHCLCKWGPSTLTVRRRILPSGKPTEERFTTERPDPTWEIECEHFRRLCQTGGNNIGTDIWINSVLRGLENQIPQPEEINRAA